jgi:hypothetical protein
MTKAKKKVGRPRLAPQERKARNLTFRSRNDLYESLQAEAEKTGHSLSEEIERRLERSFHISDPILADLAGKEGPVILRLITEILLKATRDNKNWYENRELVETVSSAASLVIARVAGLLDDALSPDGISGDSKMESAKQRGRELAQSALRDAGLPY